MKQDRTTSELNAEPETRDPVTRDPVIDRSHPEPPTPLFLEDSAEGQKGDAQDEKDKTEE